jgi:hypothetical protein
MIRIEKGERLIWLDQGVVDRLRSLRGAGRVVHEVILRIAADAGDGACAR